MGALDGRVALITGGARGQGRAHALALAAEGADIVVADAPAAMADLTYPLGTEDDLRETAKLVDELGRRCMPLTVDVRDAAAVNAAVKQTVADLGSLDIVVANAGIVSTGPTGRGQRWGLAATDRHQSDRRIPHPARGHPGDAAAEVRPDRRDLVDGRPDGHPRPGRLQRDEVGCHRPGEVRRPGGRERGNHGQRRLPDYDAST